MKIFCLLLGLLFAQGLSANFSQPNKPLIQLVAAQNADIQFYTYQKKPVLPIEPAQLPQKNSNCRTSGTLYTHLFFILLLLAFLAGMGFFAVGFIQGISIFFSLGLGLEIGALAIAALMALYSWRSEEDTLMFIFLEFCMLFKGTLLLTMGLVLATNLWILGAGLLFIALLLVVLLVAFLTTIG